ISVALRFDAPVSVGYKLFIQRPGESWIKFAEGTDEETVQLSGHMHEVGPLPDGSKIMYIILFGGNPNTAFASQIQLFQDRRPLLDGLFIERGVTDQNGIALRRKEITLR